MKGLLIKEFSLILRNKSIFILGFFAILLSVFSIEEPLGLRFTALSMWSILFCSFPIFNRNYDKQFGLDTYIALMPFKKAHIVSAKYVLGALGAIIVLLATVVRAVLTGEPKTESDIFIALGALAIGIIGSAILTPLSYRISPSYVTLAEIGFIGFVCGIIFGLGAVDASEPLVFSQNIMLVLAIVAVVAYPISWALSVEIYKKYGVI